MSFEVATEEVRAAGRSMRSAGRQLADVKPHLGISGLPAALDGTSSAATLQQLDEVWRRRFSRLATAVELHGELLVASADDYELTDEQVEQALSGRSRP